VIGHIKVEHRMDRNCLACEQGDAVTDAAYNFSLCSIQVAFCGCSASAVQSRPKSLAA
jgi:hypothetical protein